jgi:hypothetical protein
MAYGMPGLIHAVIARYSDRIRLVLRETQRPNGHQIAALNSAWPLEREINIMSVPLGVSIIVVNYNNERFLAAAIVPPATPISSTQN